MEENTGKILKEKFLNKYFELIKELNHSLNLISKNEVDFFWDKQINDSLALLDFLKIEKEAKWIDLGSGGGVPGIPLSICYDKVDFTLVDSTQKKVVALNQMIKDLKLNNIKAICERVEILANKPNFRGKFDFVSAKALAPLNILMEYAMPFLKQDGLLLAYKGPNYEIEIKESKNAFKILNAEILDIKKYSLKNDLGDRFLIFIKKTGQTPDIFPRNVGEAVRKPL